MKIKKNIIFVIDSSFPYYAGGIETWLYNVSMRLCEEHSVTIVSENKNVYQTPFFNLDKRIKVVNYWSLNDWGFIRKTFRGNLSFIRQIGRINSIKRVLKNITNNADCEYHLIALTTLYAAKAVNDICKYNDNMKFICSARGPHAEITSKNTPLLRQYFEKMEMDNLSQSDVALANGYDTIDYFKNKGIETSLMKNGVDCTRFDVAYPFPDEMSPSEFNIVSVATLLDIKGINEMIKAVALLTERGLKNIRLILVGKGGQEKYLNYAQSLNVSQYVKFIGHSNNVVPYLQNSNVICCLSGGSGLSMSALESMASGKPVIGWDTPVYQQFNMKNKCMILVSEKNVDQLADVIEDIMNSPEKYSEVIQQAQVESSSYDWKNVTFDLIKYLK